MNANTSHKGTGCGCGGTTSASPCGCGGSGCASCQSQGTVRPRFFAGQLLTEDDLQLLTDYVGHKNRLHNRHLFGAGVVCGLEVTCHPCGNGQVIVHPGYALDCCGNDLTLDCAVSLDVNAMIRDLRRDQLGGFDCLDPCLDPPKSEAECTEQTDASNLNRSIEQGQGTIIAQPQSASRTYCLYLRYCEQKSDPVMPYSTGDDCGRQSCEATRVREGVKFELRCMPAGDSADPLIRRLCECLGDLNKLKRILAAAQQLRDSTDTANSTLITGNVVFSDAEILVLAKNVQNLREAVNSANSTSSATISSDEASETSADTQRVVSARTISSPEFRASISNVAMQINSFLALSPNEKAAIQNKPGFAESFRLGQESIEAVRATVVSVARPVFGEVRDWLIEQLDKSPFLSDCTLRQRVFALVMPEFSQQIGESGTRFFVGANKPLLDAFINYLRDCACRAMNPACEPCDDTGVLLACLEVEKCAVVKVCNLERTFVLSPAAVRYWMPPLRLLGNLAERLCCDTVDSLRTTRPGTQVKSFDFEMLLKQEITRILNDSLCSFTDLDMITDILSNIGKVFHGTSSNAPSPTFSISTEIHTADTTVSGSEESVTAETEKKNGGKEKPKPKPKKKPTQKKDQVEVVEEVPSEQPG